MNNYIESINEELKEYFNILCGGEYPHYIDKYINNIDELNRLKNVGQFCGCDYTKLYNIKYWYSRLDHSIACSLMTWHFTKDKTQTISALFHDMGTPAFSHCIDFMNNDVINQESSEKDVYNIIKNSPKIKKYLEKDKVNIEELKDISIYPIVENERPKICVDRLDGIFHTCLIWIQYWDIEKVRKIYNNISVLSNESEDKELGFTNKEIAELFFDGAYRYSIALQKNEDKFTLQFLADYIKKSINSNYITKEQLYSLGEQEILKKIIPMNSSSFNKFTQSTSIIKTDEEPIDNYYVSVDVKKRYVIPLCGKDRLNEVSPICQELLDDYLCYDDTKYAYIDGIRI